MTYRIYRYIPYQFRTKIYDKDWVVEIESESQLDELIELFNSYLKLLSGLRYLITLEVQYAILWQYTVTEKIINPASKPYMWVVHQTPLELGFPEFMPRYYKDETDAKRQQEFQTKVGIGETSLKILYRNCLIKVILADDDRDNFTFSPFPANQIALQNLRV